MKRRNFIQGAAALAFATPVLAAKPPLSDDLSPILAKTPWVTDTNGNEFPASEFCDAGGKLTLPPGYSYQTGSMRIGSTPFINYTWKK